MKGRHWVLLITALILPLILLAANLKLAHFSCFNGYDLGIYQQGIFELASFKNLNPLVTIRGIAIFNDHSDPVIFLPAMLVRFIGESTELLVVFEWLTVFFILPFIVHRCTKMSLGKLSLIVCFVVFGRGTLSALNFPIHASVWSWGVWFAWSWAIIHRHRSEFLLSLLLCLFKESYPFVIVTLGLLYMVERDWKRSFGHVAIGIGMLAVCFWLRPLLVGPTHKHGDGLLSALLFSPASTLAAATVTQSWAIFFKTFAPILFVTILAARISSHTLLPLLALAPIALLQYLVNKFGFHYSYLFYATSAAILVFSLRRLRLRGWVVPAGILISVLTGMSYYSKAFAVLLSDTNKKCSYTAERLNDISAARNFLASLPPETSVIVTGGILPALVTQGRRLYHFSSHGDTLESYDLAVIEAYGTGDVYPLNASALENVQRCVVSGTVLVRTDTLLITRGPFPRNCWQPKILSIEGEP